MEQEKFTLELNSREVVLFLCALVLLSFYPEFKESEVAISSFISDLALQVYKYSINENSKNL